MVFYKHLNNDKSMIKKIVCLMALGLIFAPFNFSQAITQNQISAEVQIVCTDGADNWFSGSGTIIDPKGIILTNRHVVEGAYKNVCFIGFLESINSEPNFGPKNNPNLAEVKYITTDKSMDSAVLYLDNKNNQSFPYVNIWNSNSSSLKFGDKIEVIGYPGIGGSTMTYTSGDFSGFGSLSDGTQNYIKTTAMLEHGNSGGSAYNQRGEFIGIPSMVITGSLNSISYVLSVDSIKKWLSGFLGSDYKQEIIEQKAIIEAPKVIMQNDITPPHYNQLEVSLLQFDKDGQLKNRSSIRDRGVIYEFPKVSFGWDQDCTGETRQIQKDVCIMDDISSIAGYYYYFGIDSNVIPKDQGKYISANEMLRDDSYQVKLPVTFDAKPGRNYFILQAIDTNNNISNPIVNVEYIYEQDSFKDIKNFTIQNQSKKTIGVLTYPPRDTWDNESHVIETNQSILTLCPDYGYEIEGLNYYISYQADNSWHDKTRTGVLTSNKCITVSGLKKNTVTNLFIKPNVYGVNAFFGKHHVLTINYQGNISDIVQPAGKILFTNWSNNSVYWETWKNNMTFSVIDQSFLNKLKGRIILQVESHGEAWYVNPKDSKRYYMVNGDKAYDVMRNFGIGINNKDLEKIKANKVFAKKNSGKILLQVESRGEAYYIDFNGIAHYLKDGAAAYEVMRSLGLGIKNNDLNKITEGSL